MEITLSGGWAYLIMVLSVIGLLTIVDYIFSKKLKSKLISLKIKIRLKWDEITGKTRVDLIKLRIKYGFVGCRFFVEKEHDNGLLVRYDYRDGLIAKVGEHEEECPFTRDWNRIMKKYNLPYKL